MTVVLPRDALWLPPSGKQILRDYLTGRKADWDRLQEWIRDQIAVAAIGNPTQIGSNTAQTSGQLTLDSSSGTYAASSLVIACVINSNGVTAPGDCSGVKYVTAGTAFNKDLSNGGQSNVGNVQIWSLYDSAGHTDTVRATFPSSNMTYIYTFTIANAATSSYLDTTGTSNSSSSTAMSIATSGNVAQADSVGIGLYGSGTTDTAPSTWPGSGLTSLVNVVNTTRHLRINIEYLTPLTAGAAFTATGTLGASNNIGRCAAVYKGTGAAPPTTTASILQLLGIG